MSDELVTIKEYAKKHNISYEAVRRQLVQYADDESIKNHIVQRGRTRFLDNTAVSFLDSKRNVNPTIVMSAQVVEELKQKDEQIEALKNKLLQVQEQLIDKSNLIIELQAQLALTATEEQSKKWWQFWKRGK